MLLLVIFTLLWSLIPRRVMFKWTDKLAGPPGTAKSFVVYMVLSCWPNFLLIYLLLR